MIPNIFIAPQFEPYSFPSKLPKELIDTIFSLDEGIRYVSILNYRGAHLEGGMRPRTNSLNPEDEDERLFLQANVARGMSETWSEFFGQFKFALFVHEGLNIIQFPYGENILLVTTEPTVPTKIAEKIVPLIQKWNKSNEESQ